MQHSAQAVTWQGEGEASALEGDDAADDCLVAYQRLWPCGVAADEQRVRRDLNDAVHGRVPGSAEIANQIPSDERLPGHMGVPSSPERSH